MKIQLTILLSLLSLSTLAAQEQGVTLSVSDPTVSVVRDGKRYRLERQSVLSPGDQLKTNAGETSALIGDDVLYTLRTGASCRLGTDSLRMVNIEAGTMRIVHGGGAPCTVENKLFEATVSEAIARIHVGDSVKVQCEQGSVSLSIRGQQQVAKADIRSPFRPVSWQAKIELNEGEEVVISADGKHEGPNRSRNESKHDLGLLAGLGKAREATAEQLALNQPGYNPSIAAQPNPNQVAQSQQAAANENANTPQVGQQYVSTLASLNIGFGSLAGGPSSSISGGIFNTNAPFAYGSLACLIMDQFVVVDPLGGPRFPDFPNEPRDLSWNGFVNGLTQSQLDLLKADGLVDDTHFFSTTGTETEVTLSNLTDYVADVDSGGFSSSTDPFAPSFPGTIDSYLEDCFAQGIDAPGRFFAFENSVELAGVTPSLGTLHVDNLPDDTAYYSIGQRNPDGSLPTSSNIVGGVFQLGGDTNKYPTVFQVGTPEILPIQGTNHYLLRWSSNQLDLARARLDDTLLEDGNPDFPVQLEDVSTEVMKSKFFYPDSFGVLKEIQNEADVPPAADFTAEQNNLGLSTVIPNKIITDAVQPADDVLPLLDLDENGNTTDANFGQGEIVLGRNANGEVTVGLRSASNDRTFASLDPNRVDVLDRNGVTETVQSDRIRKAAIQTLMADQLQEFSQRTGQTRFVLDGQLIDISGYQP